MNERKAAYSLSNILTQHPKNRAMFTANGAFDEAKFTQTRNQLGMVLLLKDKQNLSSNDEIYKDKQDTYAKSNLIWNELLVGHMDSIDTKNLPAELSVETIKPVDCNGVFPLAAVDGRQRLVFEAIKRIWGQV
jgi:hypothetical protein